MDPRTTGTGSGDNGRDDGGRTVGQRVDRIGETAQGIWTETRDSLTDLREALDLEGRVDRNPYGMLAAAVGVGYVLGGGLFSPLTARLLGLGLKMGLRLAAVPFLRDEIVGLAEEARMQAGGGASRSRGGARKQPSKTESKNVRGGGEEP